MTRVVIPVKPSFKYLAPMRARVAEIAGDRLSEARIQDLRLAVSEATTNAIEAHVEAGLFDPIEVAVVVLASNIEVTVTDRGSGFDPTKLKAHPPATDPERLEYERGLGVPLMKRLADRCEISSTGAGTIVTLAFELKGSSG